MFFFQKNVFPLSFPDGWITPTKITMSHPEMIVKCILSSVVFCMKYIKNKCKGLITVSKYRETNESMRPLLPCALIFLEMFGYLDQTLSTNVLDCFSNLPY